MPAPKENQNAVKGDETATSFLHIRCTRRDKARWFKAAQQWQRQGHGAGLSEWVIAKLNAAGGQ